MFGELLLFAVGLGAGLGMWFLPQLCVLVIFYVLPRLKGMEAWEEKKPVQICKSAQELALSRSLYIQSKHESCLWLNAILGRLFVDLYDSKVKHFIADLIQVEIDDLRHEEVGQFVRGTTLLQSSPGVSAPTFSNFTVVKDPNDDSSMGVAADLAWSGLSLLIELEVVALGNMPVVLSVSFQRLAGRLLIEFSSIPEPTVAFGFYDMPDLDLNIQARVQHQHFAVISRVVNKLIRFVLKKKFVLPNLKTKYMMYEPKVAMSGYLMRAPISGSSKEGSRPGAWSRWDSVWASLSDKALNFFPDHTMPKAKQVIGIHEMSSVQIAEAPGRPFCLILDLKEKGHRFFAAHSQKEMEQWYVALGEAIREMEWRLAEEMDMEAARRYDLAFGHASGAGSAGLTDHPGGGHSQPDLLHHMVADPDVWNTGGGADLHGGGGGGDSDHLHHTTSLPLNVDGGEGGQAGEGAAGGGMSIRAAASAVGDVAMSVTERVQSVTGFGGGSGGGGSNGSAARKGADDGGGGGRGGPAGAEGPLRSSQSSASLDLMGTRGPGDTRDAIRLLDGVIKDQMKNIDKLKGRLKKPSRSSYVEQEIVAMEKVVQSLIQRRTSLLGDLADALGGGGGGSSNYYTSGGGGGSGGFVAGADRGGSFHSGRMSPSGSSLSGSIRRTSDNTLARHGSGRQSLHHGASGSSNNNVSSSSHVRKRRSRDSASGAREELPKSASFRDNAAAKMGKFKRSLSRSTLLEDVNDGNGGGGDAGGGGRESPRSMRRSTSGKRLGSYGSSSNLLDQAAGPASAIPPRIGRQITGAAGMRRSVSHGDMVAGPGGGGGLPPRGAKGSVSYRSLEKLK